MNKILIFVVIIFSTKICLGEVLSWIDNNPVGVGNIFNLYIEGKNLNGDDEPILNNINGIQVLNKSVQHQTSISGNTINSTKKWTYSLVASFPGNFKIPALKIGREFTKPILLEVLESEQNKQNEIVKLEMNLSAKKVFINQQILIQLKIIRNGLQLVNESITPLELQGLQIEKIKENSYIKVDNGKKQLITEILYVVFPEKSGSIIIPKIRYQGDEINGVNLGSIFQKFGSYSQNRGKRIYSYSDSQKINVISIPEGINVWWLPVNKLEIKDKWETDPPVFKVGEPITRTITIIADGAYADQIPELKIKKTENIKSYSDQPILETKKTVDGLKGIRIEKYAIIPKTAGIIKLPKISLKWWDVMEGKMRTSVIPEKIINIMPNKKNDSVEVPLNKNINKIIENNIKIQKNNEINQNIEIWKIISILLGVLWLITIIFLYLYNKNKLLNSKNNKIENKNKNSINLREATKQLKKSIDLGKPEILKKSLINWGKIFWKEDPPIGLEEIAIRIPEMAHPINKLNSLLYSNIENKHSIKEIQNDFSNIELTLKKDKVNKESNLIKLYPKKF